jgi:hypothetical protein
MPLTPPVPGQYGMCLLHADYHPMGTRCWAACLDWFLAHRHLPLRERGDWYEHEVEQAMLKAHLLKTFPHLILAV